jgi:hypothetical protein
LVWMSYIRCTAALISRLPARTSTRKTCGHTRGRAGCHAGLRCGPLEARARTTKHGRRSARHWMPLAMCLCCLGRGPPRRASSRGSPPAGVQAPPHAPLDTGCPCPARLQHTKRQTAKASSASALCQASHVHPALSCAHVHAVTHSHMPTPLTKGMRPAPGCCCPRSSSWPTQW